MPLECTWGDTIKDLSSDNFDFLEDERMTRLIALGGKYHKLESAPPTMKSLIGRYKRSEVMKEVGGNLHFNSVICMNQVASLIDNVKNLKNKMSVLELGAGIGSFSRIFRQFIDTESYTILDIPAMSRFSKKFLNAHGLVTEFVESKDYKQLLDRKFDLFVSNICLSEIDKTFRETLISAILPNCQGVFIYDASVDLDKEFSDWLVSAMTAEYKHVSIIPFNYLWKEHSIYVGNR